MLSDTEHANPLAGEPSSLTEDGVSAARIGEVGATLVDSLSAALSRLPEFRSGPQRLADRLGVDKVVASRLLKGLSGTVMEAVHRLPGPAPLRRVLGGALEGFVEAAGALWPLPSLERAALALSGARP